MSFFSQSVVSLTKRCAWTPKLSQHPRCLVDWMWPQMTGLMASSLHFGGKHWEQRKVRKLLTQHWFHTWRVRWANGVCWSGSQGSTCTLRRLDSGRTSLHPWFKAAPTAVLTFYVVLILQSSLKMYVCIAINIHYVCLLLCVKTCIWCIQYFLMLLCITLSRMHSICLWIASVQPLAVYIVCLCFLLLCDNRNPL